MRRLVEDRDWLVPALALTGAVGICAIAASPSYSFLLHATSTPIGCFIIATVICSIWATWQVILARPVSPLREMWSIISRHSSGIGHLIGVILVASLGLMVFTWTKSMLNFHVVFWADRALADQDRALFFGHDPWTLFSWLNFRYVGHVYHRSWFVAIIGTLLVAANAPRSPERSAVMLHYFVLWLVIGPVIHMLMPAVGPIFYERMGYGNRFAGLVVDEETARIADYLWTTFQAKRFLPGTGISAMPSLHVVMSTWIAITARAIAPKLFPWAVAYAVLIFALSISLGWHYALDGIAGALAAIASYLLLRSIMRRKHSTECSAFPVPS